MSQQTASPRVSHILMLATYIVGGVGILIGFMNLSRPDNAAMIGLSAILAVGVTGIISFIRHAIFNRSDAVAGGWDYGTVNNFQIEVGLANLAWGVFAILAVILGWGQQAIAASFLISGLYFAAVAVFVVVRRDIHNRRIGGLIGITTWAVATLWLGGALMAQAS